MSELKNIISGLITRCDQALSRTRDKVPTLLKSLITTVYSAPLAEKLWFKSSCSGQQQASAAIPRSIIGVNKMLSLTKSAQHVMAKSCVMLVRALAAFMKKCACVATADTDSNMKLKVENQKSIPIPQFNWMKWGGDIAKLVQVLLLSLVKLIGTFTGSFLKKIISRQPYATLLVAFSIFALHIIPTNAQTTPPANVEMPQLSIANTQFFVGEDVGTSGYEVELVLSKAPLQDQDVTISYARTAGTAVAGTDFSITGQSVTFDADMAETSKTINIIIMDNEIEDGNKTIRFTLSNLSGAEFSGGGVSLTRTIVIVDDEPTTFSLSSTNFRVDEKVTSRKIDVEFSISPASQYDVTYKVSTEDGTAVTGQDFTGLTSQSVTVPAGSTTSIVSIPILQDIITEGEQSFTLKIEDVVGAVISGDDESIEQTITIVDDEAATIFLDDILSAENIIEGYGNYTMNLSTSSTVSAPVNISYSSMALTATSGTDYTAPANRTLSIARGANDVSLSGFNIPSNTTRGGDKTFRITLTITSGNAVFSGGDTQKQITMTIVDDESLVLTLSNSPEYLLVEEEIGQVIVNYSLAKPISSPVSFTAALANGVHSGFYIQIAEKGHDYVDLENSTITIPPGETRGSIPISIIDDSDTEYSQGFTIRLTNPTNSVFACSVTDINTVCNENLAEFFVRIDSNDFITASFEHEEYFIKEVDGGTTFDFKVLFSDLSNASFTSRYTIETTDGTARYRTDFNYPGSFISRQRIRSDERMRTHSMTINYNANYTGNKSFTLSLIRPLNLSFPEDAVADQQVTARYSRKITIIDAQAPPINITTTDFTVDEDVIGGNLVVNYAIDNPATRQISFNYDLIDGTAEKGLDYTEEANRTATIPIGSSTGSFSIPIREDDLREGNETFTLVLSNLVGASLFNDNALTFSRTVTIIDDDPPTLSIANTPLTVLENVGAGGLVVEAMLSGTRDDFDDSTNLDVTFSYTLADDSATEGTDYTQPTSRTLRIPEGETSTTFMIPILDDTANPVAEGPETFDIVLTISDGAIFEGGGMTKTETVTIQDNDPPTLTFQTNPITGFESTGTAEIPVRVNMSAASYQDVTFNYSMNDGSARKGLDYLEEVKREVTLFTGETRGTFSIPVIDDLLNEGNETFTIILSNPTNAEFADEEETISKDATIVDNEPPRLSVTTTELTVDENVGSDGFQFTVRLSGATRQVVSFKYDLTDDTATEGQDYTEEAESERTIMIPIGDTEVTFKIPILNDSTSEGNEQFGIMLSGLTGAVFASGQDTYDNTIVIRDDELPFLSIANTQLYVGEDIGSSGYNLELELLGTIRQDVSVSYAIIGGSAVAGTDFNSSAQTVVFDADRNETSKMIPIEIIDNDDTDGDKTIQFRLSQLSGAIFAGEVNRLVRTIVIVDDEPTTFAVTTTNFRVDEDVALGQIDINYTLTPASTYDVTFDVFTQNDTALHGLDYGGITKKTVTITAGSD